jgi:hypothetical protein
MSSNLVLNAVELIIDLLHEVVKPLLHFSLRKSGRLELHLGHLVNNIGQGLLNETKTDFLLTLGTVSNNTEALVMEFINDAHHTHSFVHGAVVVVLGERVLLQELILDDLS